MLIGSTHGRLDAAVGEETTKNDILNAILTKEKVQVRGMESAKTRLALADQIGGTRLHRIADGRPPFSSLEGFALLYGLEDAVRIAGNLLVSILKGNWYVNDGTAHHTCHVHCLLGVGNGRILFQTGLDSLVERAALGGELILVLDENERRLGGVELVDGHS